MEIKTLQVSLLAKSASLLSRPFWVQLQTPQDPGCQAGLVRANDPLAPSPNCYVLVVGRREGEDFRSLGTQGVKCLDCSWVPGRLGGHREGKGDALGFRSTRVIRVKGGGAGQTHIQIFCSFPNCPKINSALQVNHSYSTNPFGVYTFSIKVVSYPLYPMMPSRGGQVEQVLTPPPILNMEKLRSTPISLPLTLHFPLAFWVVLIFCNNT